MMKVYIGNYPRKYGGYWLAEKILFWKDTEKDEDVIEKLATKLEKLWIVKKLEKWSDGRERICKVKVDGYDTWSLDCTLAEIILPCLKQLKEDETGYHTVDETDLPSDLRGPHVEGEKKWNYVLDEMIWSFSQYEDGDIPYPTRYGNDQEYDSYNFRLQNGFRLFGKYFTSLWT